MPSFIRKLQDINHTVLDNTPPDTKKLRSTVKSLKNSKSANDIPSDFVKHAMECKGFSLEMVKLFKTTWRTNKIPINWGHSKLVALCKGPSKVK